MLTVSWFSPITQHAEIWRVLDLSGMTKSVRDSRNFTKMRWVYINGSPVQNLKETIPIGEIFVLELRFPNGKIISNEIFLVNKYYSTKKSRNNTPMVLNYRG